jgi:hypothetical protein
MLTRIIDLRRSEVLDLIPIRSNRFTVVYNDCTWATEECSLEISVKGSVQSYPLCTHSILVDAEQHLKFKQCHYGTKVQQVIRQVIEYSAL